MELIQDLALRNLVFWTVISPLSHLSPVWTQYISQQQAFHITFLPCFTSLRQTLGLTWAIRSVQMRELFIWADECGNTSKLFTRNQSLFVTVVRLQQPGLQPLPLPPWCLVPSSGATPKLFNPENCHSPQPVPKVKCSCFTGAISTSGHSPRHKPGTTPT